MFYILLLMPYLLVRYQFTAGFVKRITLKSLPAHSFNAFIIPIHRDCLYNHFPFFQE